MYITLALLAGLMTGLLCSHQAGADTGQIRAAGVEFVNHLSDAQRQAALYELKDDVRATWSNLPTLIAPPAGLLVAELDDSQRQLLHDLFRASLSSQGYSKSAAIMWLDDVLHEAETLRLTQEREAADNPMAVAMAANRSSGNYAVAMFGHPSDSAWGWKITGHHLALNLTVVGDRIAFTPMFLGSNPRIVQAGPYAGWMALPREGALAIVLMTSLNEKQRKAALLSDEVPRDVFEGPGRRASLEKFEGLSTREMKPEQLADLQLLVGEYLRNGEPDTAARELDNIASSGWDKLWFSWRGDVDESGVFYYRVHGPGLLIEYNRQNPNHDHAVIRFSGNDYGEDWLEHHYREYHAPTEQLLENLRQRLSGP